MCEVPQTAHTAFFRRALKVECACLSSVDLSTAGGWMQVIREEKIIKKHPARAPSSYSTVAWQLGLCDPLLDNQAPSAVGLGIAMATSCTVTPAWVTASALWADGPDVCRARLQKAVLLNYWQTIFQPISFSHSLSFSLSFLHLPCVSLEGCNSLLWIHFMVEECENSFKLT